MSQGRDTESAIGDAAAYGALTKLFESAQKLHGKGQPVSEATLAMTEARCPEYKRLSGLEAHEAFDAVIRRADHAGAITATRTREGGDSAGWAQLRAYDLESLATFLKLPLRHQQVALARQSLASAAAQHPVIEHIIAQWQKGASVRGKGVYTLASLIDALQVAAAARQAGLAERLVRKESVRLFGRSKRLETLTVWLDILSSGELPATGLSEGEIWAQYGLRKEPQPLLLSGTGHISISGTQVALCQPYLGLPLRAAMDAFALRAEFLLSIENLTSYHDFISAFPQHTGLVVFTGGMPSPLWRHAYAMLLDALPQAELLHWGDIDQGGFRIASKLNEVAQMAGRELRPWMMDSNVVPDALLSEKTTPSASQLGAMLDWSRRAGWHQVAKSLQARPVMIDSARHRPSETNAPMRQ